MVEYASKPLLKIPAFVKSLEDMDHLRLLESIEMRDNRIQLVNLVLLFVGRERSALYPDGFRPSREALIRTCKSTRESNDSLPTLTLAFRTWDRKRIKDELADMCFHKPSRIPIKRYG